MATQKEIIRNLLLYEYQLGHDARTAAANVNRAKGDNTVHQSTAFRWFAKFRNDNTDLNDQPRSGRPQEIDRDAVIEAIEEDPTMSTETLADDFECTARQIRNILKAAG
jgi:transposase